MNVLYKFFVIFIFFFYVSSVKSSLFVIMEVIWFEIFVLVVCIKIKFCGFLFVVIFCMIWLDIGKVEILVVLIIGFIFFLWNRFSSFVNSILLIEFMIKVISFRLIIINVLIFKNFLYCILIEIDRFNKILMIFINLFCVVIDNWFNMLYFFNKFLNIKKFIRGKDIGVISLVMIEIIIGNNILVVWEILFVW